MAESSTTNFVECRNVESTPNIHLVSIDIVNVLGLTASVTFSRALTNLTGMPAAGRTRLWKCFKELRFMAVTCHRLMSKETYNSVRAGSRMSMTLSYDGRDVIFVASFGEREMPDVHTEGDEEETVKYVEWEWHVCNENGEIVDYMFSDKSDSEHSEAVLRTVYQCRQWLNDNVVTDFKEALEHMSGLPYDIMSGLMGVRDVRDISEHIGKLMPWLAMFTTENGLLFWADDIFDGIHALVVRRFAEAVGSVARRERNQYVMSSRDVDALVDTYPCWFFMDSRAVKISQEIGKRNELYLFHDDGDRWFGWKRMLDDEFDKVRRDIIKKLSEVR